MSNKINVKTANLFGVTFLVAERIECPSIVHVLAANSLDLVDDFNGGSFDPMDMIGTETKKHGAFAFLTNLNSTTGTMSFFDKPNSDPRSWQEYQTAAPSEVRAIVTTLGLASFGSSGLVTSVNEDFSKIVLAKDSTLDVEGAGREYKMGSVHFYSKLNPGMLCRNITEPSKILKVISTTETNMFLRVKDTSGKVSEVPFGVLVRTSKHYHNRFSDYGFESKEDFIAAVEEAKLIQE